MARTGAWALPVPSRPAAEGVAWRAGAAFAAEGLLCLSLVVAALAVRLWVLGVNDELNSDEVLPGLMARHILLEGERPVFFYGQHYFGALEAYLIAALFALFGFHPQLVSGPPIAASLALVPVTYLLGRHLAGRSAGWLATLPVVFAPPVMAKLYANSGGGFSLAFLLHGLTLLAYLQAYLHPRGTPGLTPRVAVFSLLAGLLGWVWQPALALLPVLLALLLWRQPALRHPGRLLLALAPLALGLAPPLAHNIQEGWPSVTQLARKYAAPLGWEAAPGVGRGAGAVWPLLLIAFGGGNEAEGGANFLQGALVAVAFPLTLVLLWREHARLPHDPRARQALTVGLLLSLVALVDGVAAHSTVRHLAPVAHLGFAFAGAALVLLARRLLPRTGAAALAAALAVILVVGPNLYLDANAERIFRRFVARASEVQVAVAALQERGLRTGYADYWTAYPVSYFGAESVVVAPSVATIWGERVDRYPPHKHLVDDVEEAGHLFLLLDDRCTLLPYLLPLEQEEATYRVERIARWYLVWDVRP
ncbi:MAG TPA: hypothetical protein VHQ00_09275, partial [Chloroflexota bacterium]|nr:hypothetical protein [Chloroflexota bacterium]